ncbi:hypothetical protein [Actinosynnema mirum]|uniref:Uncharacterized protein n=1 Tax=Actinosynnema mirum (strain ATCC 29888 / DSM 43827 / JCM 3225 / NBRC 14064 / NCIMB 13271 / NRRL B-12336 / IMRU 3971 / 101) TaxID=446462 RepID=C6WJB3_ACTMD|nr:hypothetical protein [Actinosynnema mirum]ACU34545.1 hypothetical protein Amir_0579 [Actinosynnema mirum DSM 43827]
MDSGKFRVDLDELRPIGRLLADAQQDLREQCERMPHQVTDAGRSTAALDAALVALLGGAAELLSSLGSAHDSLSGTYEEYRDTEDRNVIGQQRLAGLDALFTPTRHPWAGNTAGHPSTEHP